MQPEPATTADPRLPRDSTTGGDVTIPAQARESSVVAVGLAQSLDNHVLQEEIGQGGMGVVYRAWDPVLKRHVALKKIRSGVLADESEVERFYREARAAAQLQHPNVVSIHGMGLHQGEHCFTMALAPTTLEKQKQRYQADVRAAVALVEAVARGVQAAHDKGIIHRDLKPANILLDEHGQPRVADFGLARSGDAAAGETLPGVVRGTPYYMAPEAAAGRTWEVGTASDVWALGVILYELLTGQRPFEGETAKDILPQVLEGEPPRPRKLRPSLNPDLETIIVRCLEKETSWRYPSVAALADNLCCWLADKPIQTWPPPRPQQQVRSSRSSANWRKTLALMLTFVLFAGGLLLIRPAAAPAPTPKQRALDTIQRDLAAGKSVTLVENVGLPAWYLWRTEKTRPPLTPQRSGPLFVESWKRGLLELLPAAPPRFRLHAEVKLGETIHGSAGLYVLGEERPTDNGPQHFYCALTVSRQPKALDHSPADEVQLYLARYREQALDRTSKVDEFRLKRGSFLRGIPGASGGWCKLIVEVTPEALTVRVGETLFHTLPRWQQHQRVDLWWKKVLHHGNANPPPSPSFLPQGGLGLFVYRSTARFRNVIVEPLPKR